MYAFLVLTQLPGPNLKMAVQKHRALYFGRKGSKLCSAESSKIEHLYTWRGLHLKPQLSRILPIARQRTSPALQVASSAQPEKRENITNGARALRLSYIMQAIDRPLRNSASNKLADLRLPPHPANFPIFNTRANHIRYRPSQNGTKQLAGPCGTCTDDGGLRTRATPRAPARLVRGGGDTWRRAERTGRRCWGGVGAWE